jgi:hypothetical protein
LTWPSGSHGDEGGTLARSESGRELRALTLRFDHGVDLQLREGDDLHRSTCCPGGTDAAVALADDLARSTAGGRLAVKASSLAPAFEHCYSGHLAF